MVLLSGETVQEGLEFLPQASRLPGLFVVADAARFVAERRMY
jgi:hypothetical protein